MDYSNLFVCLMGMGTVFVGLVCIVVLVIGMSVEKFLAENTVNTVKYVIKKELRWRIRDMLDQLNINERTVYPGLDGLSRWLARHYFVRSE